ncbi:hypothetical protein L1987_35224 [Smallanthus sonchifolius]|uniref:Uncharacterized protein n=1 Tax=Smallanthus sonchifolius TaxID=185202 RepID=A0ACB9HVV5_9ASTR|nr:hypothetical protein L1987_35224 [Smallanthus sonchifolius]
MTKSPLLFSLKNLKPITLISLSPVSIDRSRRQVILFSVSSFLTFLHNSSSRRLLLGLHRRERRLQFKLSCVVGKFYAFRMPRRKAKKDNKQSASSQLNTDVRPEENAFTDQEVERQSAPIRTFRDVEIERLLTAIRLLKSSISKEHLQTPLLQFFEENLPNLTVARTVENGPIEVKWKDKDGDLSMTTADGGNMISYFLQHMSLANPEFSTAIPSLGGFDFSSKAGLTSFIGADNLQMKDFVLEEPSDTHILGVEDYMQTPGVTSGRLSVGMTPKTLRLPKQGEMLLSVHGSPLGVYKENTMDAIHETEEE